MQNLEFKAELRDPVAAKAAALRLGARFIADVEQVDTYFRVPHGRLKRREAAGEPTEYIFYHRKDEAHPKISQFTIYDLATARERFGLEDPPIWVIVRKRRQIYMYQNVRIHLDDVEGLGSFLELEALISTAHNVARCHEALGHIRRALEPALGELIAVSYADLLASAQADSPGPCGE
ncbi:MAG: class IV adenylate cyclase [Phycisphaerales bacterium JB039]